jgi:hypothetical protein
MTVKTLRIIGTTRDRAKPGADRVAPIRPSRRPLALLRLLP